MLKDEISTFRAVVKQTAKIHNVQPSHLALNVTEIFIMAGSTSGRRGLRERALHAHQRVEFKESPAN